MAYAHVQTVETVNNNVSTIAGTGSGNHLVVNAWWSDSTNQTPTLSDNKGGGSSTYTLVGGAKQRFASTAYAFGKWYVENTGSGITAITLTWGGGTPGSLVVEVTERSGLATSSSLIDNVAQEQSGTGTGTGLVTSGTKSITVSGGACIEGFSADPVSGTTEAADTGAGFTSRQASGLGTVEDRRITSTATVGATFTASGTTGTTISWMAAFAEPTSATTSLVGQTVQIGPGISPNYQVMFKSRMASSVLPPVVLPPPLPLGRNLSLFGPGISPSRQMMFNAPRMTGSSPPVTSGTGNPFTGFLVNIGKLMGKF